MRDDVVVRRAQLADVDALDALAAAAYGPYLERMDRPPAPLLADHAALVTEHEAYVATADGRVVGLLVVDLADPSAGLLHTVTVDPAAQGSGLGRRLVALAEQVAREAGHDRIRLYTNEVMTENLGLYAHLGYAEVRRSLDDGYRRVHLAKRLVSRQGPERRDGSAGTPPGVPM